MQTIITPDLELLLAASAGTESTKDALHLFKTDPLVFVQAGNQKFGENAAVYVNAFQLLLSRSEIVQNENGGNLYIVTAKGKARVKKAEST